MAKMVLVFLTFTCMFAGIIHMFQASSKLEVWKLTKLLGFSILCSLLTLGSLSLIVMLF